MGLLSGVSSVATVAAGVTGGVINLGKGVINTVGKISKSLVGKFALGALAVGILTTDPKGDGNSLFARLAGGFKSFIGDIGSSAKSYMTEKSLDATAVAMRAANNTSETIKDYETAASGSPSTGLREAVTDNIPMTVAGETPEPAHEPADTGGHDDKQADDPPSPQVEMC